MISNATRIAEQTTTNEVAELIAELRAINESGRVSNLLRSMTVRPSLLGAIRQTLRSPGDNGRLTRAQHELIAQYVAAQDNAADAATEDDLHVSPEEQVLLEFVGELIQQPYLIADAQVNRLHAAGWTDTQIAEAVYDANLYHLIDRIDAAFPTVTFAA